MSFEKLSELKIEDSNLVRTISVYHGDLANIPDEHAVDLLVTSAFPNGYYPSKSSLIGALETIGISLFQLSQDKEHDLRKQCHFWISKNLGKGVYLGNIKQIACFESGFAGPPPSLVGDLFRGLFPFLSLERNSIVAMPVLAAGDQGYPIHQMFDAMVDSASHWMSRGLGISELKIVVLDRDNAMYLASRLLKFKQPEPVLSNAVPKAYDVFLSYSSLDADAAKIARNCLAARQDISQIFDFKLSIDPGVSWQKEIDAAIVSARSILAITSPSYFASPECQEELQQARLRHKREGGGVLFPIYWRDDSKSNELWLQTINGTDCREANISKLKDSIPAIKFKPRD